jgi:hypothetical protein
LSELREIRGEIPPGVRGELLQRYLEQSEEYAESIYEDSIQAQDGPRPSSPEILAPIPESEVVDIQAISPPGNNSVKVTVRHFVNAGTIVYELDSAATGLDLKQKIFEKTGVPIDWFWLLSDSFPGGTRKISDDVILVSVGIDENSKVYNLPNCRWIAGHRVHGG